MGGLSWLQVGSKPGLETAQGLGCHYFLGQAIPFGYGPGEEWHLSVLCPTGGNVVAVCVVLSVARTVFCWLW